MAGDVAGIDAVVTNHQVFVPGAATTYYVIVSGGVRISKEGQPFVFARARRRWWRRQTHPVVNLACTGTLNGGFAFLFQPGGRQSLPIWAPWMMNAPSNLPDRRPARCQSYAKSSAPDTAGAGTQPIATCMMVGARTCWVRIGALTPI